MSGIDRVSEIKKLLQPEQYECPYCSEKFNMGSYLLEHVAAHKIAEEEAKRQQRIEEERKKAEDDKRKKESMEQLSNRLKGLL